MRDFNKLFIIGLTKTGTNSVTEACNTLGVPIRHYPDSDEAHDLLHSGKFRIPELETHRGISDVMAATFYAEFDREYPGSLFIMTVRSDREAWAESCRKKMKGYPRNVRAASIQQNRKDRTLANFLRVATYGIGVWDKERFIHVYERHLRDVYWHFSNRPDDLLVLDLFAPDVNPWTQLCRFLECPEPSVPFPHMRNSGSRQKRESREAK